MQARSGRRHAAALAACILAALAVRALAVAAAPRHAYLMDHVMFMAWSAQAYEHGPRAAYDLPVGHPVWVRVPPEMRVAPKAVPLACNYPPLATVVFWLQGMLWHALDDQVGTGSVTRVGADGRPETVAVRSRVVNTTTSRLVNALPGVVADLGMAWGVLHLVRILAGGAAPGLEVLAFGLVALAPPMVLDAAFWSQSDSWVSCVLVWCLVAALRARFTTAGLLYGAALMLKAQAVLLAPALAFVGLALAHGPGGSAARAWRASGAALLGAVAVVAAVAAPFSLGRGAGLDATWLRRAYLEPVLEQYPYTTTKAFNLWWLEGAAAGEPGALRDARARVLGMTKDTLGRLLLAAGILAGAALAARRFGWTPAACVAVAFLAAFAAFVLPTRVKARYVYYGLPFLIAAALHFPPWRPALAGLLVVATFELTWNLWWTAGDAAAGLLATALAAATTGLYLYSLAALVDRDSRIGSGACESSRALARRDDDA